MASEVEKRAQERLAKRQKRLRSSYEERSRLSPAFWIRLLKIFMVTEALVLACLGGLWFGLVNYEKHTPIGALTSYVQDLRNKDYGKIYDESFLVFKQMDTKQDYMDYLDSVFGKVDFDEVEWVQQDYSTDDFIYYNAICWNMSIATVEIKKGTDDEWHCQTMAALHPVTIDTVVDDMGMKLNGFVIDESYHKESGSVVHSFDNLHNPDDAPKCEQYYVPGFVKLPSVEVNPEYIAVTDALEDVIYVGFRPDDEERERYAELIQKVSETYCKFISEDDTFYHLSSQLYHYTNFYDAISTFDNSWFSTHDKYEFANMKIFDLIKIDDNHFTGKIEFDYIVTISASNKVSTYHNLYQVAYKKVNGTWLCTEIVTAN